MNENMYTQTPLLNGKKWHLSKQDFPCLIHGKDKTGASLFTVSMLAALYSLGYKVLFLSGYHMARDEFIKQTNQPQNTMLLDNEKDIISAAKKQVIFVSGEDPNLFIKTSSDLKDIKERIILIKNFDLFDEALFDSVKHLMLLVLSGDLDKCPYKEKVVERNATTRIFFSQPQYKIDTTVPPMQQYQGYLISPTMQGIISLEIK